VIAMNTQDFRFPSFPRRRESSQPLKRMDTRFRGYDEFTGLAKVLTPFLAALLSQEGEGSSCAISCAISREFPYD
jgi:hypothetical protein